MQDHPRLQRLSAALYWVALALSVLLPIIVLVYAGKGVSDPASLLSRAPLVPAGTPVTSLQAGLVAALALISVLPMVAALRRMVQLFGAYRDGEVLSRDNADTSTAAPATALAVGLALSGISVVMLGLASNLMAAGLLTVIGWAMREAAAVKAENAAFV